MVLTGTRPPSIGFSPPPSPLPLPPLSLRVLLLGRSRIRSPFSSTLRVSSPPPFRPPFWPAVSLASPLTPRSWPSFGLPLPVSPLSHPFPTLSPFAPSSVVPRHTRNPLATSFLRVCSRTSLPIRLSIFLLV